MRYKQHTSRRRRDPEAKIRNIVRETVRGEKQPPGGLGTEIAARFEGRGLREDIPELRGFAINPSPVDQCGPATRARGSR